MIFSFTTDRWCRGVNKCTASSTLCLFGNVIVSLLFFFMLDVFPQTQKHQVQRAPRCSNWSGRMWFKGGHPVEKVSKFNILSTHKSSHLTFQEADCVGTNIFSHVFKNSQPSMFENHNRVVKSSRHFYFLSPTAERRMWTIMVLWLSMYACACVCVLSVTKISHEPLTTDLMIDRF